MKHLPSLLFHALQGYLRSNFFVQTHAFIHSHFDLLWRKLYEDSENGLFSVVLFKRSADDFKNAAREHKSVRSHFSTEYCL
jgi:hypothetical protein